MKKIYILFAVVVLNVFLISCGQSNSNSSIDNTGVSETTEASINVLDNESEVFCSSSEYSDNATESETTEVLITVPDNVSEVIISPRAVKDMSFKYTDDAKIDAIVSYIRDLGILPKSGSIDPGWNTGSPDAPMEYEIILNTSEGNTEVYYLLGNRSFRQGEEGEWCEIEYATMITFRDIIQENEPDVPAKIPLFWDVPITIPENVTEVTVECSSCGNSETYQYTDPEKVNAIVSYISDLGTLKNTERQFISYAGGITYIITFYSADGISEIYYDKGLIFRQGEYGQWCDVKLGHTNRLEELLETYELDVMEEVAKEE